MFDEIIKKGSEDVKAGKNMFGHYTADVITPDGSYTVNVDYDLNGNPKCVEYHKKFLGIFG